jgi:hypothetical protein
MSPGAHRLATNGLLEEFRRDWSVQVVAMDKNDFYASFKGQGRIGLFFCDADHSYEQTRSDLTWAKERDTRIICGHDYDPDRHPGASRAVDEFGGPTRLVGSLFVL